MIDGVIITPLDVIDTIGGDVLHGIKSTDQGYSTFGEAYFSIIEFGAIKGWKRHREMTLNLIVPVGAVRFILYEDRNNQSGIQHFQEVTLSRSDNYARLTVPPLIWMGFQGLDQQASLLLNIASIEHSANEIDRKAIHEIEFNWS
jgi:dTDP-4-dehydrorhamnose 3,5-epimerase